MSRLSAVPMRYRYFLYGVRVTSDAPFDFSPADEPAADDTGTLAPLADVELVESTDRDFPPAAEPGFLPEAGFTCRTLADGSVSLRWKDFYEFSVAADGSRIACRPVGGCDRSVLQNFLFGQALAVALVQQGIEPLHAAVTTVDDGAIGLVGDCTFGKSTLLAAFLQAGHRAVTDDLLILDRRSGEPVARSGSGRIKLMPDSASQFPDGLDRGTRLNPKTTKRTFQLGAARRQRTGLPLRQLFMLPPPDERDRAGRIDIQPLSRVDVVRELLKSTFARDILNRNRLARQFAFATGVASEVDGFRLQYPSGFRHLSALREAIVDHVRRRDDSKDIAVRRSRIS